MQSAILTFVLRFLENQGFLQKMFYTKIVGFRGGRLVVSIVLFKREAFLICVCVKKSYFKKKYAIANLSLNHKSMFSFKISLFYAENYKDKMSRN